MQFALSPPDVSLTARRRPEERSVSSLLGTESELLQADATDLSNQLREEDQTGESARLCTGGGLASEGGDTSKVEKNKIYSK